MLALPTGTTYLRRPTGRGSNGGEEIISTLLLPVRKPNGGPPLSKRPTLGSQVGSTSVWLHCSIQDYKSRIRVVEFQLGEFVPDSGADKQHVFSDSRVQIK